MLVTGNVIAGEAMGKQAVIETRTPIIYLHYRIQPGGELLASALRTGLIVHCIHLHAVTFSDINLQLFNRLQPSQDQFLVQFLTSISSICRESSDESVTFCGPFFERLFLASALPLQVTQAITACHSFVTRQL